MPRTADQWGRARVGRRSRGWSTRALLERYVRAWEKGDLDTIVALLHDDVTLSMPPSPTWIAGRTDVAHFFTKRVMPAMRAVVTRRERAPGRRLLPPRRRRRVDVLRASGRRDEGRAHPGHRPLHDRELVTRPSTHAACRKPSSRRARDTCVPSRDGLGTLGAWQQTVEPPPSAGEASFERPCRTRS